MDGAAKRKRPSHKRGVSEITPGLAPVAERLSKRMKHQSTKLQASQEFHPSPDTLLNERGVRLQDFDLITLLGKGGFGRVWLSRKKDTREVLALKIMDKKLIWGKNKVRQIKNERDVLANNVAIFLNHLIYSFQDKDNLYLAMEFCPGGDLRRLLSNLQALSEEDSRLYFAEMIMATHQLHQLGYIHRDLKPDNFLISDKGHLRLTDFGLSKDGAVSSVSRITTSTPNVFGPSASIATAATASINIPSTPLVDLTSKRSAKSKAFSVVGSPNYMSPEVIHQQISETGGYSVEVDWWSLGCIFYEVVVGAALFDGETPEEVFEQVQKWKQIVPSSLEMIYEHLSGEFIDLLQRFLTEPTERWGDHNIHEIKQHPFFAGLDWTQLQSYNPPFIPELSSDVDTSYFIGLSAEDDSEAEETSQSPSEKILADKGLAVDTQFLKTRRSASRYQQLSVATAEPSGTFLKRSTSDKQVPNDSQTTPRPLAPSRSLQRVQQAQTERKGGPKPRAFLGGVENQPLLFSDDISITCATTKKKTPLKQQRSPADKEILGFTFQRKRTGAKAMTAATQPTKLDFD